MEMDNYIMLLKLRITRETQLVTKNNTRKITIPSDHLNNKY
jgi:hypothetical protein